MTNWHSLYLSSEQSQTIIATIHKFFETQGYKIYNPFGALPGMSYPDSIKTFLAPPVNGWSRLLVDGDGDNTQIDALTQALSHTMDCLSVRLDGNLGSVQAYRRAEMIALVDWARPYLKTSDSKLEDILAQENFELPPLNDGQIGDVPLDSLPDDIQAMARQVNAKEANKLFEKLSNQLLKAVGRNSARSIINEQANWDSQGGQYIRAIMDCLSIPDDWRTPDFPSLRTAYALAIREQEGVSLQFQGEESSMINIPNALDYQPVYGGKIVS